MQTAIFGAGCFWGVEKVFKKNFPGALTRVGYVGGQIKSPSYEQVCSGRTGHAEAIKIDYDENVYSYESLVDFFFRMHDPTTKNRQGNDRGTQYRSAIFYNSPEQLAVAQSVLEKAREHYGIISTTLEEAGPFWDAESYHQDYLTINKHGYECPTHFVRTWERIKQMYSR